MKLQAKQQKTYSRRANSMFRGIELKMVRVDFLNIDDNFILSSFVCFSRESFFNDLLEGFQMNNFFKGSKLVRFNLYKG